ncbi:hypothetical protein AB7038_02725 [Morganella morganii]|uniref:hypothetical protein n=1 Tax=Morganella morganii TaxID=582 RepID=UPI0034E3D3D4
MIDIIRVWLISQSWFWKLRTRLVKISFLVERSAYKRRKYISKGKANVRILGSFTWIGLNSLFWVALALSILGFSEDYIRKNTTLLNSFSSYDKKFIIEQLRLYAQLLTAIFSIYFATIGIILSTGYTKLRRDIIQLLTTEQVGSVYSQVLVLSAAFCLSATALQLFGFEPGIFIYILGTFLTLISSLALFPLGQRLFNFFNLNQLVRSEILPRIARHIEGAANPNNSVSLANHHSKAAHSAIEQLCYIDDRMKGDKAGLGDNLPALSDNYIALLLHYLHQKHRINNKSYWFPRRKKHKQWFLVGDTATTTALKTSSQLMIEEDADHQWLENVIIERLTGHIELAFETGNFELGLNLISRLSLRISTYAEQFQFDIGMQELQRIKELIEKAFYSEGIATNNEKTTLQIEIADSWAALGSNLCLETLRRMITFEKELRQFFDDDVWTTTSLQILPPFLQVELEFIIEHIDFERKIEGQRLSKPKYIQQLAVQKLLQKYAKLLPKICSFYESMVPSFINSLTKMKMSEAATQVILASLHSHWKLPHWFDDISQILIRYEEYEHYSEKYYLLPKIDTTDMINRLVSTRNEAIIMLSKAEIIEHIFEQKYNDKIPDHFGQIYFELAEACIHALELNDEDRFIKIFPMFMSLSLLASDNKFIDPELNVSEEFRLHLISTTFNDLASVLGFAILYSAYFDNPKLSEVAVKQFELFIAQRTDKQHYLKKMILLSNSYSFSWSTSPRNIIRLNWKMAFEQRAQHDGFLDRIGISSEKIHKNKIVREFLISRSDASHLFFALQILPQLDSIDFTVDDKITSLSRRLSKENKEDS